MAAILAIPAQLTLGLIIAVVTTGPRSRKRIGVALSTLSFAMPFLAAPEYRVIRFGVALGVITNVFRSLDLYFDERAWPLRRRIWHMFAVFDTRGCKDIPRSFELGWLLKWFAFSAMCAIGVYGVWAIEPVDTQSYLLRWLFAAIYTYASLDLVSATVQFCHRLAGIEVPPVHDNPILSRTLGEFWGQRWNRIVHDLLSRYAFRPLVRRKMGRLGLLAAFLLSAVVHAWITMPALGWIWAGLMASFFIVQAAGILLERPLGVTRWPRVAQHTWTIVWVLAPAPLLLEPILRMLMSSFAPMPVWF